MNKLNHPGARLISLYLVMIIQMIASISLIGCDDSPTQHRVNLELSAVDAHNQPLDDVTLLINGMELNFTQGGYLRDSFPLSDGSPAHVELQAPEGYKLISPQEASTPLSACWV